MSMLVSQYNRPKQPGDLTFDLESGVRVRCDVGYPCANFSLSRPDVRDRQTDVRQNFTKASLNAPPIRGRHNELNKKNK